MADRSAGGALGMEVRGMKPPHYGGNKIPASYLKKFLPARGKEAHPEMPVELRLFLEGMK